MAVLFKDILFIIGAIIALIPCLFVLHQLLKLIFKEWSDILNYEK